MVNGFYKEIGEEKKDRQASDDILLQMLEEACVKIRVARSSQL